MKKCSLAHEAATPCLSLEWTMTGSPKECRAHAMVCSRMAETLPDGRSRQMFAALAKSWLELATDVENSQALLDTCSDLSQPYRFASRIVDYGPRRRG